MFCFLMLSKRLTTLTFEPKTLLSEGQRQKYTNVQWYANEANQTGMQVVVNRMNKIPRPCDSTAQPRVKNVHSEEYCDSNDSIYHKNRFEVLSVEDCVSDKCNPSVIVDLKGDSQRHTSNTVNVKT